MNTIHVLMIEDNMGDVLLIREAIKMSAGLKCDISHFTDGDMALDYLMETDSHNMPNPADIVFLDINLPKKSGFNILHEIKTNVSLKHLPVIMFSSSESDYDINRSYTLQANCYITKPIRFDELIDTISTTIQFWGEIAKLPSRRVHRTNDSL